MELEDPSAIADMVGFDGHQLGLHKSTTLQLWGNRESMNINSMVLTNIKQSPYFKYELAELKTFHEVVDAIYYKVAHLEPWERGSRRTAGLSGASGGGLQVRGVGAGGIVSSAYCLLYKLFTMRINRKQLQTLLDHPDSPYIRGLGFMYIRYCLEPKDYWDWFQPYMDDQEEIDVKAGGGCCITVGEMLRQFLTQLDWYGTLFPRIPVPIEKELRARLQERAAGNSVGKPTTANETLGNAGTRSRSCSRSRDEKASASAAPTAGTSRHSSRQKESHHHHHRDHKHHRDRKRSRSRDRSRSRSRDRDRERGRDRGQRHDKQRHHHHHSDRDR